MDEQKTTETTVTDPTAEQTTTPATSTDPATPPDQAQEKTYTATEYNALKEELDKLQKEKLTQEELTRIDLTKRETDVANREAAIRDKENRLHAIDALEQANLVGNGITTADLIPFVMDSTTKAIDDKVKSLQELLEKCMAAQTQRIYQSAGRQPHQVQDTPSGSSNAPITFGAGRAARQARAQEIRNSYTGGTK